jgi:hypothetical protein
MLKDHSTELRDELLSKRPATEEAKDVLVEIQRRALAYPRLVEALRDLAAICDNVPIFQLDRGKASVKAIRLAGKFTTAHSAAKALLRSLGESE